MNRHQSLFNSQTELVVLQSTSFCNIDCSYCYLPDKLKKTHMQESVISAFFENFFSSGLPGRRVTIVWHAGEPMTLHPNYYRNAIDIIESYRPPNVEIIYSIQTNGTMISNDWCDLIIEKNIQIGISIDGPQYINDKHRKLRNGTGSYERTMTGIKLLTERNIHFSIIAVIDEAGLQRPNELHDFFANLDPTVLSFNVPEIDGLNTDSWIKKPDAAELYREFIKKFWLKSISEQKIRSLREMEMIFRSIFRPNAGSDINHQNIPFAIISVGVTGNISTFSPELLGDTSVEYSNYIIGNVCRQNFSEMAEGAVFKKIYADIMQGIEACRRHCGYFSVCGGGAPANKMGELGNFTGFETAFCRVTKKAVCDVALSMIENEALEPIK